MLLIAVRPAEVLPLLWQFLLDGDHGGFSGGSFIKNIIEHGGGRKTIRQDTDPWITFDFCFNLLSDHGFDDGVHEFGVLDQIHDLQHVHRFPLGNLGLQIHFKLLAIFFQLAGIPFDSSAQVF